MKNNLSQNPLISVLKIVAFMSIFLTAVALYSEQIIIFVIDKLEQDATYSQKMVDTDPRN